METKICTKCKETKSLSEFTKNKKSKDGLRAYCRECASKYFKAWLSKNKEYNIKRVKDFIEKNPNKKVKYSTKYINKNKTKIKEYYSKYYLKNADKLKNRSAKYLKENPEKVKKAGKIWRENNKEYKKNKDRVYGESYRIENKIKIRQTGKKWRKENPDRNNAKAAKYRASKLKATPPWLTKQQLAEIANIYKQAKQLEKETGLKYHVDHIIPLKGKDVCGLHTPWNLQILKAEENLKKNNKI